MPLWEKADGIVRSDRRRAIAAACRAALRQATYPRQRKEIAPPRGTALFLNLQQRDRLPFTWSVAVRQA